MFCPKCGAQQADNATFCTKCGAALNKAEAETRPIYVSQPTSQPRHQQSAPQPDLQQTTQQPTESYTTPTMAYANETPSNYQTDLDPDSSTMSEKEQNKALKRELKESKAAYKQARKNAGKSNAPKIVGIIIAIIVVVALAVCGTLYATGAFNKNDSSNTSTQQTSSNTSQSSSSDTSTSETSNYAAYEGTWTGAMVSTASPNAYKKCYGATNNPVTLTIESISSTGQLKGSIKVLWHGHQTKDLENDAEQHDGDKYITISNFTSTFSSSSNIDFKGQVDNSKNYVQGSFVYEKSNDTYKITLTISSYADSNKTVTDTYELTKSN